MAQENDWRRYRPPFPPLSPLLLDAERINSALGEGFGLLRSALGPQQLLDNIISILKSGVDVAFDTEEQLLDLAEKLMQEIEEFGGEVEQIPPRLAYQIRQLPGVDRLPKEKGER